VHAKKGQQEHGCMQSRRTARMWRCACGGAYKGAYVGACMEVDMEVDMQDGGLLRKDGERERVGWRRW
jgi:hypothetical protein